MKFIGRICLLSGDPVHYRKPEAYGQEHSCCRWALWHLIAGFCWKVRAQQYHGDQDWLSLCTLGARVSTAGREAEPAGRHLKVN